MKQAVNLTFRHLKKPAGIDSFVERAMVRLGRKYNGLVGCDIVIDVPHQRHRKGNKPVVRLTATISGMKQIVSYGTEKATDKGNIFLAIEEAFSNLEHQLSYITAKMNRRSRKNYFKTWDFILEQQQYDAA